ncbi:MAG: response regulator [Nitrospirae bacterium]|nr:MAG: response regulator [Nitrospirota bacterium]
MNRICNLVGKRLRDLRQRRGWSQEKLAEKSELHPTYIGSIERGQRNPSLVTLAKLVGALNVSLSALFNKASLSSEPAPQTGNKDAGRIRLDESIVEILLVEDSPSEAQLAIRALRKCNFSNQVHIARDGAEALELIFCTGAYAHRRMDQGPGAVLLDLGLPKVDGLEVLRRIRSDSRTRRMPVVVLTSSRSEKDLRECRKLGVMDYITKPVDFEQFSLTMPRLELYWLLLKKPPRPGIHSS